MRARRLSGNSVAWGLLWLLVTLGVLILWPTAARAAETETLPPAVSVPLQSADDVFSRERPSPVKPSRQSPLQVKPYRVLDPDALRQWREFLRDHPDALQPAPGFVEDGPNPRRP